MKKKVLYIEDNEQSLYLATYLLNASGYEVIGARTGSEGLAAAARHLPDLVLLDLHLPVMDGFTVARALRLNPTLAEIPIVVLTSSTLDSDREKAFAAGCAGYIEKPMNLGTFSSEVGKYMTADEGRMEENRH